MTQAERIRQENIGVANYINRIAASLENHARIKVRRTKNGFWVKQIKAKD
jgi:hypothetical protein